MLRALTSVATFVLFALPADARADSTYCRGEHLVRTGQTTAEVLDACGEPTRREARVAEVCRPWRGRLLCSDTPVDAWIYEEEGRVQRGILFHNGEIVRIVVN